MAVSVKPEPIQVSDSEASARTEHVASADPWLRRSTRARKASIRFSPGGAAPPASTSGAEPTPEPRQTARFSDSNSSSTQMLEMVEPHVLITYVDELKMKIRAGAYGVKMPIGPDEYVLVDGVDYLKSLGYSDFEDEGEYLLKVNFDAFRKTALFEPQRAKEEEDPPDEPNKQVLEFNFWDSTNESASSSFVSLSRDSEAASNHSSEISIGLEREADVESPVPQKKRYTRKHDANYHNYKERMRRLELATQFSQLSSIVHTTDVTKIIKVRVLADAVKLVQSLKREQMELLRKLKSLHKSNDNLRQKHDRLVRMSEANKGKST